MVNMTPVISFSKDLLRDYNVSSKTLGSRIQRGFKQDSCTWVTYVLLMEETLVSILLTLTHLITQNSIFPSIPSMISIQ